MQNLAQAHMLPLIVWLQKLADAGAVLTLRSHQVACCFVIARVYISPSSFVRKDAWWQTVADAVQQCCTEIHKNRQPNASVSHCLREEVPDRREWLMQR